ncbi:MAG TPA: CBS domain-containing protein [Solirubrobacterales bacterium]|jgi:CBS domain-containing protein|nr:CBS domain-containing protein [Solirubrobacterales bacterium]
MPDSIVQEAIREIEPLCADDSVGTAARRVVEADLPALPAVDEDGRFAGIFGEREFMAALFPGYVAELGSAGMVSRRMDEAIERRLDSALEPIRSYMTTDAVLVEDDYSDTQLAQLFLNHQVLIIPIATDGRVHAVVTRQDFFHALVRRFIVEGRREEREQWLKIRSTGRSPRTSTGVRRCWWPCTPSRRERWRWRSSSRDASDARVVTPTASIALSSGRALPSP